MATAKLKPTIEEKIRTHYQSENDEWLIEKGKVKEARLLKEAVERIDHLKKKIEKLEEVHNKEESMYFQWYNEEKKKRKETNEALRNVKMALENEKYHGEHLTVSIDDSRTALDAACVFLTKWKEADPY